AEQRHQRDLGQQLQDIHQQEQGVSLPVVSRGHGSQWHLLRSYKRRVFAANPHRDYPANGWARARRPSPECSAGPLQAHTYFELTRSRLDERRSLVRQDGDLSEGGEGVRG